MPTLTGIDTRIDAVALTSVKVGLCVQAFAEYQAWMDRSQKVMNKHKTTLFYGIKMEIKQCTCANKTWVKLIHLYHLYAKDYQADIWEELHRLGMKEGNDLMKIMKIMKRFNSVLLKVCFLH